MLHYVSQIGCLVAVLEHMMICSNLWDVVLYIARRDYYFSFCCDKLRVKGLLSVNFVKIKKNFKFLSERFDCSDQIKRKSYMVRGQGCIHSSDHRYCKNVFFSIPIWAIFLIGFKSNMQYISAVWAGGSGLINWSRIKDRFSTDVVFSFI